MFQLLGAQMATKALKYVYSTALWPMVTQLVAPLWPMVTPLTHANITVTHGNTTDPW